MATLAWTAADGTAVTLDGTDKVRALLNNLAGIDVAPRELTAARRLSADGSARVGKRWGERALFVPVLVQDGVYLGETIADLAYNLLGPGVLTHNDGTRSRELRNVEYRGGLEGQRGESVGGFSDWMKYTVELVALDPWWYGEGDVASLSTAAATAFDDAGTAFDSSSDLFDGAAATPVTVGGHAEAYPVITITGAFTTLTVGVAGGLSLTLAGPLATDAVLTIDTRPGMRGPRLSGGDVDWSLITSVSRLFTLPVGPSVLIAAGTGTDGSSSVEVEWDERWLTP